MPPRWPVEPPTPTEYIHVHWELKSDLGRLQSVNYIDWRKCMEKKLVPSMTK